MAVKIIKRVVTPNAEGDLQKMHNYVERLKKGGDRNFPLVATETFVESMRESGYKSTGTAIDEFIDNSIQAHASRVDIVLTKAAGKEEIAGIAIVDNGHGMEPDMIRASVMWGGTHRAGQRDGFGRFGFGLPSAAVSMTRRFDVFSKLEGGAWHGVTVDLDKIAQGMLTNSDGIVVSPMPAERELPDFVMTYLTDREISHGTVIVINSPDRLTSGFRKAGSFVEKAMEHIGLTYRGILRSCEIFVDSRRVEPVDPLFLDPACRYYDIGNGEIAEGLEPLSIEMKTADGAKTGMIQMRFSHMPYRFQRVDGELHKGRFAIMRDNNAYFIACRAGRQLDLVERVHFPKARVNIMGNNDRNWAIELDFDPVLDEEFGVTVNKQQVTLSERVWAVLDDRGVPAIINTLMKRQDKERYDDEHSKRLKKQEQPESERVAAEAKKFQGKTVRQTPEKEQRAAERVTDDAAKVAEETKRPTEEVVRELLDDISARPFKLLFEQLEGAPIYRGERYGAQMRVYINMRHRFYTDLYAAPGTPQRTKTALELLIFALATAEVDATGDRETFYRGERGEWSKTLDLYLSTLDKRQPLKEVRSDTDEEVAKH
jgi:Histidine kinase-, DNA gyrase B-, and HSP90-like ATPase